MAERKSVKPKSPAESVAVPPKPAPPRRRISPADQMRIDRHIPERGAAQTSVEETPVEETEDAN